MMNRTTRHRSMGVLALFAALLLPTAALSQRSALESPGERYQYAAKFVCGKPKVPVVAPGEYFTAINVHNPHDWVVKLRKKVAVALPDEKPGKVSRFRHEELKGDQAFEIDCPDIIERISGRSEFLKGFVVIESELELDVVAVYTATSERGHSLHTERVPYRVVGRPSQVKAEPEHCPAGGLGAGVGSIGCCCNKPRVHPPAGSQDWWPDCKPGLICAGNLSAQGLAASTFSVCTDAAAFVQAPIHSSQPAFCGQR